MYELWIQDNDVWAKWHLADLGNDMPAMNFQANDIAELKNRQADYSQAIKLPISKNNAVMFGFSNEFDVYTDFPYQRHNCRLYSNGYAIAGKGSFLILDRVTQYFECQILSGNADLLTVFKETDMANLNLGYYTRDNNSALSSDAFEFAAATFIKGGSTVIENMKNENTFPFIFLEPIIRKMIESRGFTFQHNLGSSISNKAISLADIKPTVNSFEPFKALAETSGTSGRYFVFNVTNSGYGMLSTDTYLGGPALKYISTYSGTIRIRLDYTNAANNTVTVNRTIGSNVQNSSFSGGSSGIGTYYVNISFLKGDTVWIRLYVNEGQTPTANIKFSMDNITSDDSQVPMGGRVYFAPNLGFNKQLDFFKMFLQCFGLTVLIDNSNKIVYAYTMDKLYENKIKAKDWSKKLHHGKNSIRSYTINNYAQNNSISLEDNSDDNITDTASFAVDNRTLDNSKELFKIDLQSGRDNLARGLWYNGSNFTEEYREVANIPLMEKGESGNLSFKGSKVHLVELLDDYKLSSEDPVSHLYRRAKHIRVYDLISGYYQKLTDNMLNHARVIEEELFLTDQDIEEFDQFVPVYIEYFGAFFYVNKIKNYISGRLTKCELIKL